MTAATLQELMAPRRSGFDLLAQAAGKMFADELSDPVAALREDRTRVFEPLGVVPDSWQRDVLHSVATNIMLVCSRQAGKSFLCAALALLDALLYPDSEVLIISRTLRQASELMRKVKELWRGLTGGRVHRRRWRPVPLSDEAAAAQEAVRVLGWDGAAMLGEDYRNQTKDLKLSHELPNYSRITCLPGNPDNIVSFSAVTLLILDEASRVPDELRSVVSAFLAATEEVRGRPGRLVSASTPFGKRGWFWEQYSRTKRQQRAWADGAAAKESGIVNCPYSTADFERQVERRAWQDGRDGRAAKLECHLVEVRAQDCPRIKQDFLDNERVQLGKRWYEQEYEIAFNDLVGAVFSYDDIHNLATGGVKERKLWV